MRLLSALAFLALAGVACKLATPGPSPLPGPGPATETNGETTRIYEGSLGTVEWLPDLVAWRQARVLDEPENEEAEAGFALGLAGGVAASPSAPAAAFEALGYTGDDRAPVAEDSFGGPAEEPVLRDMELGRREARPDAARSQVGGGGGGAYRGAGDTVPPGKQGQAQGEATATWQRAQAATNAVKLFVGDEDQLPLDGIEARAWVDGIRARVLLDCSFTNDRDRQLEGTFKLRLPEGATPYYLAFGEDVVADGSDWHADLGDRSAWQGPEPEAILASREERWRGAREARFVPRGQAARAYKAEVRRGVDPALMEWAGAGIFQARVFPIFPQKRHRVVVGYELDLTRVPVPTGEAADTYELDLAFPADLPALGLELSVLAPHGVVTELLEPPLARDTSERWLAGERQVMSWPATDERTFRLRVDHNLGDGIPAIVSDLDGGYVALDLEVDLGDEPDERTGSSRAIFLVDTSLSAAEGFATRLELLEAILTANRGDLDEFAVLLFDVTPRWWRDDFVPNDAGTVERLLEDLRTMSLEGATDLAAALAEAAEPTWARGMAGERMDLFLLSDGNATWGPADRHAILRELDGGLAGALFAYSTGGPGTDRAALDFLTRETGGAVFSVAGPADLERAATAHHGSPWTIAGLGLGGADDLVLRGRPTAVYPGQVLRLVGRGTPREGDAVRLDLSRDGLVRSVRVGLTRTLTTPLAARAYGVVTTPQLEEFGRETRAAAEAFATRFRVPGKAASLLMLEDEAAYERQGVLQDADLELARTAHAGDLVSEALGRMAGVLDDPALALFELLEPLAEGGGLGELPIDPRTGLFRGPATGGPRERRPLDPDAVGPGGEPEPFPHGLPVATLVLPPEFTAAITALPADALTVGPGDLTPLPLATTWAEDVPAELREALASGEPAYDLVQTAAAARLERLGLGDATRLLSCLVELNPGDGVFARDVAQTLTTWGLHGHAYHLLLRVAEARPFEPQSYLSLARAAEELDKGDLAGFWYTVALSGQWEGRFGDLHQIAAFDAMHFLRRAARGEVQVLGTGWLETGMPGLAEAVTPISLAQELELAVAIQWNTDGTDIDLHVVDPALEHCYYGHRDTAGGGHLSADVTQGYGPELYTIPYVESGETIVWARFFASNPSRTSVRTKVLATLYQNWGAEDETVERRVIELTEAKEEHGLLRMVVD